MSSETRKLATEIVRSVLTSKPIFLEDSLVAAFERALDAKIRVLQAQVHELQERTKLWQIPALEAITSPKVKEHDPVNHPSHYTSDPSGVECIRITRHRNFNVGNAIKYLWRAGLKDSSKTVEDLKKAIFYINDEIERLNNQPKQEAPLADGF